MKSLILIFAGMFCFVSLSTVQAETRSETPFSSVVLWAYGFSDQAAAEVERDAIKTYEKKGIHAIAMVDLIADPTARNFLMIMKKARATGAQAVLQIANRGITSRSRRGLNQAATNRKKGVRQNATSNPTQARSAGGGEAFSFTTTTSGSQFTKRTATYTVWLIDVQSMRTVWTDRIKSSCQPKSSWDYIAEKALRKASRKAIKAGYFTRDLSPENNKLFEPLPSDPTTPGITTPEIRHAADDGDGWNLSL